MPLTDEFLRDDRAFSSWWWLARAYHSYALVVGRFFEEWGITGAQYGVLRCLSDAGEDGLMLSDLSKRLMVTCGNTTGVVDRMEQANLLRRERRTGDRRVVMARLTTAGEDLFQRMRPPYVALVRELMAELSPEEKEALSAGCEKLHLSLESRRQADPAVDGEAPEPAEAIAR